MSQVRQAPSPVAAPPRVSEQELSATWAGLLAQPGLWPALRWQPAASAQAAPWTTFWATRLDSALSAAQARAQFEAAFTAFDQAGEPSGALLCIAAIIEGFYVDEGPLDPLDAWIAALCQRLPAPGHWPSVDFEARILSCGVGVLLRAPSHPMLADWAARAGTLLRQLKPGPGRVKLATFLAQYHFWRGEIGRTALIVDAMPGLDMSGLLPGEALMWLETVANLARCMAQPARGQAAIDAALRLLHRHGLHEHEYALHAHGASLALAAGDGDAAQAHLDAMRPVLDQRAQADQTHYWHFLAGLSLARGDSARAVALARMAMDNSGEIGGPYRSATHALGLGQALLRAGEAAEALACVDSALAAARSIDAALIEFTALLMRAACLLRLQQTAQAQPALQQAWAAGAKRDFATTAVWWLPEVMSELASSALAQDIEAPYVRRFVRRHALPGPDPLLADWPWPLVLRGFGEFDALLQDAPLQRATGKTAQRPLDLLRALLAHGSAPLPVNQALQWLWPDADAPAQRKAFDVTLLRLRRMLDDPRLLHLEGGRLRLDERWVYTDVRALQALMQAIGSAQGATLAQLLAWGRQLLALMRGPFLGVEASGWAVGARERYRQRFVVSVAQLAAHIEPQDPQAAIGLYERALDVEPLAESLSRRLMRLHASRGDQAEALRVWRACRTMLRVAEGMAPSLATRALATELGLNARDG